AANTGSVTVRLWIPTVTLPLWSVLTVTLLAGLVLGLLIAHRRARRARPPAGTPCGAVRPAHDPSAGSAAPGRPGPGGASGSVRGPRARHLGRSCSCTCPSPCQGRYCRLAALSAEGRRPPDRRDNPSCATSSTRL